MPRHALLALLGLALTAGCDAPASPVDAGPAADAGADAGPALDPSAVAFVSAETEGAGPWARWGFQVAWLDDASAIVFGGTDAGLGSTVFGDVFRVTIDADGALHAEEIAATGPAPRYCGCATWDAARERVVVYGGRNLEGPATLAAGTWELDIAAAEWTERLAELQPVGTLGCAMAYAASSHRIYLFGGANGGGAYDATYRYDSASGGWVALEAAGPLARYDAVFLPSPIDDSLLLFGGSYGASGAAFYADLWRFDPATEVWALLELPEGPAGRRMAWIAPDAAAGGLYLGFGFDGQMQALGDLHFLDLRALTWTPIEVPFEGPLPRGFSPALPGGPGALGTMIGGFGSNRAVEESWRLRR